MTELKWKLKSRLFNNTRNWVCSEIFEVFVFRPVHLCSQKTRKNVLMMLSEIRIFNVVTVGFHNGSISIFRTAAFAQTLYTVSNNSRVLIWYLVSAFFIKSSYKVMNVYSFLCVSFILFLLTWIQILKNLKPNKWTSIFLKCIFHYRSAM